MAARPRPGPLLYRLTALRGTYASNGGITSTSGTGFGIPARSLDASALSTSSTSSSSSSTSSAASFGALIAVATPVPLTPVATAATPVTPVIPVTPVSTQPVTVGASTPKTHAKTVVSKAHEPVKTTHVKLPAPKKPVAKAPVVHTVTHVVESKPKAEETKPVVKTPAKKPLKALAIVSTLHQLVLARKGKAKPKD